MKESFEIPIGPCDITEIRSPGQVAYILTHENTSLVVSTDDDRPVEAMQANKFANARVRVIVDIDHEQTIYKGIEPCLPTEDSLDS